MIGDPVGLRKEIVPEIVSLMVMRFSLYKNSDFFPSHTTEYRSFFVFRKKFHNIIVNDRKAAALMMQPEPFSVIIFDRMNVDFRI